MVNLAEISKKAQRGQKAQSESCRELVLWLCTVSKAYIQNCVALWTLYIATTLDPCQLPAGFTLGFLPPLGSLRDLSWVHMVMRVFSYPQPSPWTLWTHFWSPSENSSQTWWVHFSQSTQSLNISTPELFHTREPRVIINTQNPNFQPISSEPHTAMDNIWWKATKKNVNTSQSHRLHNWKPNCQPLVDLQLLPCIQTKLHQQIQLKKSIWDSSRWSNTGYRPNLVHSLKKFKKPWQTLEQHSLYERLRLKKPRGDERRWLRQSCLTGQLTSTSCLVPPPTMTTTPVTLTLPMVYSPHDLSALHLGTQNPWGTLSCCHHHHHHIQPPCSPSALRSTTQHLWGIHHCHHHFYLHSTQLHSAPPDCLATPHSTAQSSTTSQSLLPPAHDLTPCSAAFIDCQPVSHVTPAAASGNWGDTGMTRQLWPEQI